VSFKPKLDFDVVREPWNKYELADGAILKTKVVVTRIIKKTSENNPEYGFDLKDFKIILTDEIGEPSPNKQYNQQEIQNAIIKDDIHYTTISEEWNEYVADDGSRLRLKTTVTRVAKTSLFDNKGIPVYLVEMSNIGQVKLPRL
jgi:hypothetical protein